MTTALHLVPEPDDEPDLPYEETAGEYSPADDEHADVDGQEEDEEPVRVRALAMPDLRPYTSLTWVADVINAGIAGARRARETARQEKAVRRAAGERPAEDLRAFGGDFCKGSLIMLRKGAAWVGGEGRGPDSFLGRLGILGFAGYCCYRAVGAWPDLAPYGMVGAWCISAVVIGVRATAKAPKTGRKEKVPAGVQKQPGPPPLEAPVETLVEVPEETPVEPPLTALIRAEIGGENGVHLCDLRPVLRAQLPGLGEASDEALRQVLIEAGWDPSRKFRARGHAGRQGVHRSQLPPPPSPGGGPESVSGPLSGSGDAGQRGSAESSGDKPESGADLPFDSVRDPERGPNSWKIVRRKPHK